MPDTYGDGTYGAAIYGGAGLVVSEGTRVLEPLGLYVEVEKGDGSRYRWDAESLGPSVPQAMAFSTKRMEGFERGSLTLRRRIDRDHPDIELFDTVRFLSHSGQTVYEGRTSSHPRQLDADGMSISIECTGWMAHMRDRKMREIYVDRELGRWQGPSAQRRIDLIAISYTGSGPEVVQDTAQGVLRLNQNGAWVAGARPHPTAQYDAGPGMTIGKVFYAWKKGANISAADTNWTWEARLDDADTMPSYDASGNLRATGPGSGTLTATSATQRYAELVLYYAVAAGADNTDYNIDWTTLAVVGNHGLTTYPALDGTGAPAVYASDVIRHIVQTFCPKLNAAGVQATTYPIPHLAFTDQIDPYDAILEINKHHLWDLAVWENGTVHYGPTDLTDYDWEVRLDDEGTTVNLAGDTSEDLANGIVVEFDNALTGKKDVLTPSSYPELADTSPDNPVNRHGLTVWTEVSLSSPTTQDAALQIGRGLLAEHNAAKQAGSINVTGYIRDRQGNRQPGWKVRAGDTVAVTDHPSDRPRLVSETSWNADSHALSISLEQPTRRIDAFLDRLGTAMRASGIAA